jgi:hypothetical protein
MPDIFVSQDKEKPNPVAFKKHHTLIQYDKHTLSAFRHHPERASFLNKVEGEEVVLIVRRHFITNLRAIFIFFAMIFAPAALVIFPILSFLPGNFQLVALFLWYMIATAFAFEAFLSWFFNVDIVTTERLVDVNFANLIYREITDVDLEQIQDVKVRVGSVIRTIFKYGDVLIQTAAENSGVIFEAIPNPDEAARIIRELREAEEIENLK